MLPQAAAALPYTRVRARGVKRFAWIAFFVLGLCFWIPALLRAKLGASAVPGDSAVGTATPAGTPSALPETPAAIRSTATAALGSAPAAPVSRLLLTTTILGRARRAAIVNGRLYREGDQIGAGSELYRLAKVAEDRIEVVALRRAPGTKRSVMLESAIDLERDRSLSH